MLRRVVRRVVRRVLVYHVWESCGSHVHSCAVLCCAVVTRCYMRAVLCACDWLGNCGRGSVFVYCAMIVLGVRGSCDWFV